MKQLIEKFKKDNPIPNIYISYGKMWDLDVDVETLGNNVFLISSTKKMFRLERKTEFYVCIFGTNIEEFVVNGQEYIYKPYSFDNDEFVVLLDLESEEFKMCYIYIFKSGNNNWQIFWVNKLRFNINFFKIRFKSRLWQNTNINYFFSIICLINKSKFI